MAISGGGDDKQRLVTFRDGTERETSRISHCHTTLGITAVTHSVWRVDCYTSLWRLLTATLAIYKGIDRLLVFRGLLGGGVAKSAL